MKDVFNPVSSSSQKIRRAQYWRFVAVAVAMLGSGTFSLSQSVSDPAAQSPTPGKPSIVKSLRIIQEKDGPAVEILSTRPLVPTIQAIGDPPRIVIDLPNARMEELQRISVKADQINALRANQFTEDPPIARVVVDLQAPRAYTWDAAGNRLVVHLGKNPSAESSSPFQTPSVPSLTPAAAPPVVAAVRAPGPLSIAGDTEGVGSAVTAGSETTVLSLSTGGEVRVCPGTTLSITPSENRHNVFLSMNTGALEAHVGLDASSDSVMTPDFRIAFAGPGEFHYAISADNQGNTCVRALPGNTASAMVTELIDNRSYQVKATDQLMFHSGQIDRVDTAVPVECGCPTPHDTLRTALPTQTEAQSKAPPQENTPGPTADAAHPEDAPATQGAGAPAKSAGGFGEMHVEVSAPFVFQGNDPPPAPDAAVSSLPSDSRTQQGTPAVADPLPPDPNAASKPAENPPPPRGFFKKITAFFSWLMR